MRGSLDGEGESEGGPVVTENEATVSGSLRCQCCHPEDGRGDNQGMPGAFNTEKARQAWLCLSEIHWRHPICRTLRTTIPICFGQAQALSHCSGLFYHLLKISSLLTLHCQNEKSLFHKLSPFFEKIN